jgi:hypothetical protein
MSVPRMAKRCSLEWSLVCVRERERERGGGGGGGGVLLTIKSEREPGGRERGGGGGRVKNGGGGRVF